tara:strand:- start:333 stop:731 length:399 start_codon:yes stop_codon:yes gene_type:complete
VTSSFGTPIQKKKKSKKERKKAGMEPTTEDLQKKYELFLTYYGKFGETSDVRQATVYRAASDGTVRPHQSLLTMETDDLVGTLDTSSPLVQKLLHQVQTYDCSRQKILALVLDRKHVFSNVYWVHREIDKCE